VLVTTKVRMWSDVEVEADSVEEAKAKALEIDGDGHSWEFEDWEDHEDPFIAADDDVREMA